MRVRWVPVVVAPALVLLLWWSLVFAGGRSSRCVPALVASCTILLMLARWGAHAHTHPHTRPQTRTNF